MDPACLSSLESLCTDLYTSSNTKTRHVAGDSLQVFFEEPSNLRAFFSILSSSQHSQLLYLCLTSIARQLPSEWFRLSAQEKQSMYSSLYSMLVSSSNSNFISGGVSKALSRVCRLGYMELEEPKGVVQTIKSFIHSNPSFLNAGLKFFSELINEINDPARGRSWSASKKTSQLFREAPLGLVFEFVVETLNSNLQGLSQDQLVLCLSVCNLCLGFDFMGIQADDASEDTSCLQVPLAWKSLFEKPEFFEFLQFLIVHSTGEVELLACRMFNHVGAIRKSMFASSFDLKKLYLERYLQASTQIMMSKKLASESLVEFVQGQKRFLSNFGMKEVCDCGCLAGWLEALAGYSVEMFKSPSSVISSSESTWVLWNFVVFESNIQLSELIPGIKEYVKGLFESFLVHSIENLSVEIFEKSKEPELKDQLETISSFSVNFYPEVIQIYEKIFISVTGSNLQSDCMNLRLAWLIFLASGFVSIRDGKDNEADLNADAQVVRLVFEVLSRLQVKSFELELSYLAFSLDLCKSFVNNSNEKFWLVLDNSQESLDATLDSCLNLILDNCFSQMSSNESRLISSALDILEHLAKGYYSNKYMMRNERVQNLMTQYLTYPLCLNFPKLRTKLFNILLTLWVNEDLSTPLDVYLTPLADKLQNLTESGEPGGFALAFKELIGISTALTNSKTYFEFFEWFFYKFSVVMAACSYHLYESAVMDALLGFLFELTFNRNSRIKLDISFNHGIVLFKNVSAVITGLGKIILERRNENNYFKQFSSKIKRLMGITNNLLSGGYVPFGVFEVYNDSSYLDTLEVFFSLMESVAVGEITDYSKVLDIVYEFIETLCKSHLKTLFTRIERNVLRPILLYLMQGIRITNMKHCSATSSSISYFCDYVVKVIQKNLPEKQAVQERIRENDYLMVELFRHVVEVIVLEDSSYMWTLSKPLLGMIILNEAHFESIKNLVMLKVTCSAENHEKLSKALNELMNGISRTLDPKNRDRFGKNFSTLRQVLGSIYG